jgi:hypothetical protein
MNKYKINYNIQTAGGRTKFDKFVDFIHEFKDGYTNIFFHEKNKEFNVTFHMIFQFSKKNKTSKIISIGKFRKIQIKGDIMKKRIIISLMLTNVNTGKEFFIDKKINL